MQQEIAQAADAALRKYHENCPVKEKTPEGVAYAMKAGVKEKTGKLNVKMMKLVAVSNPAHTPGFLQEVCFIIRRVWISKLYSVPEVF